MNAVDITTKDPWYTGLMGLPTAGYADGVMDADIKKLQSMLAAKPNPADQLGIWQDWVNTVSDPTFYATVKKITPAQQKDYAAKAKTVYTDAFNKWMEQAKLPTSVQTILSDDPTAKLPSYLSGYLALDSKDPASVEAYKAQIKKDFGGLKKSNGDPVISDVLIDQVASGKQDFSTLNDIVSQAVTSAVGKELGSAASQISDITKTDAYQNLLSNPSALTSSYNSKVAGLTQDATTGAWAPKTVNTDTSPKPGITSLGPYSGSISDVDTPAKMKQVVDTYDPNKGVYRAPSLDASGNLVSNATSPYSNILNGMLSGYKNPYAAGYTNQLKMPETPNLTNIKKPFESNPTSADLLKLANSAGQPYDPNAKTSLSPALSKMYQPSVINSAGQPAKPGTPDTTNTTLPVVPKAGEPIVTDTGKVVTPPVVNPPVVNPPVVNPPVVNPPVVNPPVVNPPVVNPPVVNPPVTEGPWTELGLTQAQYEAGQKSFAEAKARGDAARAAKAAADKIAAEQKAIEDARIAVEKATNNGVVSLTQGTDVVNQNLVPTNTDNTVSNVSGVPTKTEEELRAEQLDAERQAGLVALANQQATEKAAIANTLFQQGNITAMPTGVAATGSNVFEKPPSTGGINETVSLPINTVVQAVNPTSSNQTVALPTSVIPSVSAGNNFTGMSNNIGPQQVTLNPSAVVTPSGINALSAQTVALPTSGPQPINPSNGGPSSAITISPNPAQNNLGPLNISNLGAVISPQAMNSTAGGVASLVGPQVTVQPQPAVTQQLTSNIVAGVGTNPALRAKVLAAQAANMKK